MAHLHIGFLILCHLFLWGRANAWSLGDRCQACSSITRAFGEGLKRTRGSNFGGGNTAWEERKLGKFATSETRLVDIMEKLCSDASKAKLCHQLVEEQEDFVETWWQGLGHQIEREALEDVPADAPTQLYLQLCVEKLQACCPMSHFGPACSPCPLDCSGGRGSCHGNGSRSGDGHCVCRTGYTGKQCENCSPEGFFRTEEGDCEACSAACARCSGKGPHKCESCAKGYEQRAGRCVDIDECAVAGTCVAEREFCENTEGSFHCRPCSPACRGCSGAGPDKCRQCATGHQLNVSGACADVNECSADSQLCRGPHQVCRNTVGSFRCDCKPGFRFERGTCVPVPPQSVPKRQSGKSANAEAKKKKNKKRIWTKRFTREFLKFLGAVGLLGLGSFLLKGRVLPVLGMAAGCGAFLYSESLRLDNAFMRKKVL